MKQLLLCISAILALTPAASALTPDAAGLNILTIEKKMDTGRLQSRSGEELTRYRSAIIALDPDSIDTGLEYLESHGAVIFHRRDELLLACLPVDFFGEEMFRPTPNGVKSLSLGKRMAPVLDAARRVTRVDEVHAGAYPLPCGFDGTGIIAGFSDVGFDPAHQSFDGRVGMMTCYNDTLAQVRRAYGHEAVNALVTDNPDDTHACHVAGILAGGRNTAPYHGVAYGAEIAAATSILYDTGILAGVEDIIAYAKEQGKPAVINLSLGAYNGPHDGTDLFCQYLDRCADDAVIVMSAGNEGWGHNYLGHDFTADEPEIRTLYETNLGNDGMRILGQSDVWSADSRGFEVRTRVFDTDTRTFVLEYPWITVLPDEQVQLTPGDELAPYYTGTFALTTEISKLNGRACAVFSYDLKSTTREAQGRWSRYFITLEVKGEPGVHVDMYSDATYSYFNNIGVPGFTRGGAEMSFSNIATGHKTIGVGALVSRNSFTLIDGSQFSSPWILDNIAPFSSWGTLPDGRVKPDISAPGAYQVSAVSTPYVEAHPGHLDLTHSRENPVSGRTEYWWLECGTSMSSPHVAGVFALWLEADPTLTGPQLREIAQQTARMDFSDITNPQWGASGCIDALAGLQLIIKNAGITGTGIDKTLTVTVNPDRTLTIGDLAGRTPSVRVADMRGLAVDYFRPMQPGIYIVEASYGTDHTVRKILVK